MGCSSPLGAADTRRTAQHRCSASRYCQCTPSLPSHRCLQGTRAGGSQVMSGICIPIQGFSARWPLPWTTTAAAMTGASWHLTSLLRSGQPRLAATSPPPFSLAALRMSLPGFTRFSRPLGGSAGEAAWSTTGSSGGRRHLLPADHPQAWQLPTCCVAHASRSPPCACPCRGSITLTAGAGCERFMGRQRSGAGWRWRCRQAGPAHRAAVRRLKPRRPGSPPTPHSCSGAAAR